MRVIFRMLHPKIHELCTTFFKTYFPGFEEINAFSALRLDRNMSFQHRRALLKTVAMLEKCDHEELWHLGYYIVIGFRLVWFLG